MKNVLLLMSMLCIFTLTLSAQQKVAIQLPQSAITKQVIPRQLSNQRNSGRELIFEEEISVAKDGNVLLEHALKDLNLGSQYEVELTMFTGDADLRIYAKGDEFRLLRFSEQEGQASESSFYERSDLRSNELNITIEAFGFSHATCRIQIFEVTPTTSCHADFWFLYNGNKTSSSNCTMTYSEGHDLSVKVGVENQHEIKEVSLFFGDLAFFDDSFPFEWSSIERNMSPGSYPIKITMTDNCGNSFDRHCTIVIERKNCNADFWFLYNGDKTSSSNCTMTYSEGHDLSVKVGVENQHEIKEVSLFFGDQAFFDDSFPFEWSSIERNMSPGSYPIQITMTDNCGNSFDRHCTIVIERKTCFVDCWFDYKETRTSNTHCEMMYEEGHNLSVKVGTDTPTDIKEVLMIFRNQAYVDATFPFEWNEIDKNMSPGTYPISMTITDKCDNTIQKTCTIIITEKRPTCINTFPAGHNLTIRAGVTQEDDIKEIALIFRDLVFYDDTFPFEWIDVEKNMSVGSYPITMLLTDNCGNIIQKECTIIIEPKVCETNFWFEYKGENTSSTDCEMIYNEGHNLSVTAGVKNEADIQEISLFFRDQAFFDDTFPFEWKEIEKNMSVGNYPIRMLLTDDCGNTFERACTIIVRTKVCATDLWFDFSENSTDGGGFVPKEESNNTAKKSAVIDKAASNVESIEEKANSPIKAVEMAIKEELPSNQLVLIQNVPNPFEETTSFRFYNPTDKEVAFSVVDLSGKQLVQQKAFYAEGWQEVRIDSRQLEGAGVYIFELNNGREIVRKKMMAIK